MMAIVLSACLISDPGICLDQTIPLTTEVSAVRCAMTAPPHLAQWSVEHPEWRVVRWRCHATNEREI
jgi:hypothetical protein